MCCINILLSEHQKGITIPLRINVALEGGDIQAGMFEFEWQLSGQSIAKIKNMEDGIIRKSIGFKSAGNYVFTIQQIAGTDQSIEYDDHVETLTVVIEEEDGALKLKSATAAPSGGFENKVKQSKTTEG